MIWKYGFGHINIKNDDLVHRAQLPHPTWSQLGSKRPNNGHIKINLVPCLARDNGNDAPMVCHISFSAKILGYSLLQLNRTPSRQP